MTDNRKLLELAAKAAGYVFLTNGQACSPEAGNFDWNPLINSADCAAMCAKLEIQIAWLYSDGGSAECWNTEYICRARYSDHNNDREAAWRFAATQVAAAIGEGK